MTNLGIAAIAGLFMTIIGALGTSEASLGARLLFWITVMVSGSMVGGGVSMGVDAWGKLTHRPVLRGLLVAIIIALPITLIVTTMRSLAFGLPMVSSTGLAWVYFYVLIVSIVMVSLDHFMLRPGNFIPPSAVDDPKVLETANTNTLSEALTDAPFKRRLPPGLREQAILALQAEDHYLRIHFATGSEMILMRLSDAISELGGIDGSQTHRSWWVARDAIKSATRAEGRASLTLINDVEAPVSRSFYKPLSDAGWFT